jgi:hypothetical protein
MTRHPLEASFHRVRRAEEHLADLKRLLQPLVRQHLEAVSFKYDPQPPHDLLVERAINMPAPMEVPVRVGEVCYNLRSALDYFVFALALRDSGSKQPGTQFPIEHSAKSFVYHQSRGWLAGINPSHVARIEALQPYRGCEWAVALQEVSNKDKHREFVEMGSLQKITPYDPFTTGYDSVNLPKYRTHHPVHGYVDVKFDLSVTITFGDRTTLVIETLEKIKAGGAQTLADFAPDFEGQLRGHRVPRPATEILAARPPK